MRGVPVDATRRTREATILELNDFIRVLRRSWILILSLSLVGLLTGAAASYLMKPTYTAETQLFVAIQDTSSVIELQQGSSFTQARVQSYVEVVTTPAVLKPVIRDLSLNTTPSELAERVTAESGLDTVLITISVDDHSAQQSAEIAEAVGQSLIQTVENLESSSPDGKSPVKLSVVASATPPATPSGPNAKLNLALGLFVGLACGVGAAFLRATLDTKIRGEADLRSVTDAPFLGGISFDQDAMKKPLITQIGSQSPRAESFRHLRTNMQFANISGESNAILVTSSLPGEGKSTTAINLAISLSQAGQSVALVDADLRRPMVSGYLGLEGNAGLTTTLIGKADVNDLLQPWGTDQLYVLTSGQIPPNPSEVLGSNAMLQLIRRLESAFDAIIIDAPPLLPVTDAAVLSQHVGGVILVTGSQEVTKADVEKSLATLNMVEANVLGVVLNKLPTKGPDAYSYSSYSYESRLSSNKLSGSSGPMRQDNQSVSKYSDVEQDDRGIRSRSPVNSFRHSRGMTDSFDEKVIQGRTRTETNFPRDANPKY